MAQSNTAEGEIKISENIIGAVRAVSEREWDEFFRSLKEIQFTRIEDAPTGELVDIQSAVKGITVLQSLFQTIREK